MRQALVTKALERATDALTAGKLGQARDGLIEAWRTRPLPDLADTIDALHARIGDGAPLFAEGSSLEEKRASVERARTERPRDPRLATALLNFLHDVPFTSSSSRPTWTAIFRALDETGDPRVLTLGADARSKWAMRADQLEWMDARLRALLDAVHTRFPDGPPTPTAAEAKALDSLARALPRAEPPRPPSSRAQTSEAELLAAIYEHPEDDGARAVYADVLTERGDPRGELITLQLAREPSAAAQKRIQALLKAHQQEWIGPLAPFVAKQGLELRRGFLAGCQVKLKNEMDVQRVAREPSWATIERLSFGVAAEYVSPIMRSLVDLALNHDATMQTLLSADAPWKIERLWTGTERPVISGMRGTGISDDSWAKLAKTDRLPGLASLTRMAPAHGWLATTFCAKQLREVTLGLQAEDDGGGVVTWLTELAALPALREARLHASRATGTWPRWTFRRDTGDELSIGEIELFPGRLTDVEANLARLSATALTELVITLGPGAGTDAAWQALLATARVDIERAVKRQTRLTKLVFDF